MKRLNPTLFWAASGLMVCASLCTTGCDDRDSVRVYQAPKDAVAASPALPAAAPNPPVGFETPPPSDAPRWVIPPTWKQLPAQPMRFATFQVDPADPSLNVIVTALGPGPETSDLLANVVRWEKQIGAPVSDAGNVAQVATHSQSNGLEVDSVDLKGPPAAGQSEGIRMLSAMIPSANAIWFLKFEGPESKVIAHRAEFDAFLKSFSLPADPATPAPQTAVAPPVPQDIAPSPNQDNGGGSTLAAFKSYQLPKDWTIDPQQRPMRLATIHVGPTGQQADLIITALPADGFGTPDANINRWRGQAGLDEITDVTSVPRTAVTVGGSTGSLFDFAGPRSEVVVALITHGNQAYFFKLIGPTGAVAAQKQAFNTFLQSIQFSN
jgi:hypothetical protein